MRPTWHGTASGFFELAEECVHLLVTLLTDEYQ